MICCGLWIGFQVASGQSADEKVQINPANQALDQGEKQWAAADAVPELIWGFWEESVSKWFLEIKPTHIVLEDQVWTYDRVLYRDTAYSLALRNATGEKRRLHISGIDNWQMTVMDIDKVVVYGMELKRMGASFRKIGIEDLPSNYFGHWSSKAGPGEVTEILREAAVINGQRWEYHDILWLDGQYRITLHRNGVYHLWIPTWVNGDRLSGVFNQGIQLRKRAGSTPHFIEAVEERLEPEPSDIQIFQMPDGLLGFWEDEQGDLRMEIHKHYMVLENKVWTYENLVMKPEVLLLKVAERNGRSVEFQLAGFTEGRLAVRDLTSQESYQASKRYDSSIRKLGVDDLPSNYLGYWSSKAAEGETTHLQREVAIINGQRWKYHEILWMNGRYRITFQRKGVYHIWNPEWINGDRLTGVFNHGIQLRKQESLRDKQSSSSHIDEGDRASASSKFDLPETLFGNWSNRNGEWIFDIRKDHLCFQGKAWSYLNAKRMNGQYILEVAHISGNGQRAEIKRLTFRFIYDYWMEVTDNGELFEVLAMPFTPSFHLVNSSQLPDHLLSNWHHTSGQDTLPLLLQKMGIQWNLKKWDFDQIIKKEHSFYITAKSKEGHYHLLILKQPEEGFLELTVDGQSHLYSKVPPGIPWPMILMWSAISFAVVAGLAWLLLRWRTTTIQKREQKKRRALELEMKALRSQMNPHFLFNSLNSIQSLINKQDPDKANHYLSRFSRLMRKVLNNSESAFITLEEEVALLELYCELEALRFDFDFSVEVDSQLDPFTTEIPGMLIQPFVENAIHHGIGPTGERGMIEVAFGYQDGQFCCSVADNGIGIRQAQEVERSGGAKRGHFGIRLAEERLKMIQNHYGSDLRIEIKDKRDLDPQTSGTLVLLFLPSNLS